MSFSAVILAAGEGTRLRPLTQNRPKALIPIANRPIVEYVIDSLVKCGIRDIIVVVGYRKEQVMRHLGKLPFQVKIVEQKTQLGTANALMCAKDLITSQSALILPGDNYIDPESIKAIMKVEDSMLVATHKNPSNFGVVTVDDGRVVDIIEKPARANRMTVSCGVFNLTKPLIEKITALNLTDAITELIKTGHKISAVSANDWQDAIYPWDLTTMNSRLITNIKPELSGEINHNSILSGKIATGKATKIDPFTVIKGPVIIGKDCIIGPHVVIGPECSIGNRVIIEPFTVINRSIIMDDCHIGCHCSIKDSIVGDGCNFSDNITVINGNGPIAFGEEYLTGKFGVIIGNGARLSAGLTLENCIIGNDVTIERTGSCITSKYILDNTRVM